LAFLFVEAGNIDGDEQVRRGGPDPPDVNEATPFSSREVFHVAGTPNRAAPSESPPLFAPLGLRRSILKGQKATIVFKSFAKKCYFLGLRFET
jgi:hypothetical protein